MPYWKVESYSFTISYTIEQERFQANYTAALERNRLPRKIARALRTQHDEIASNSGNSAPSFLTRFQVLSELYDDTSSQVRKLIETEAIRRTLDKANRDFPSERKSLKSVLSEVRDKVINFLDQKAPLESEWDSWIKQKELDKLTDTEEDGEADSKDMDLILSFNSQAKEMSEMKARIEMPLPHLTYLEESNSNNEEVLPLLDNIYTFLREEYPTPGAVELLEDAYRKVNKEYTLRKNQNLVQKRQNLHKNIALGFMVGLLAESLREKSWVRRGAWALVNKVRSIGSAVSRYFTEKKHSQKSA